MMRWFWHTVWACASGFAAYPRLAQASRREVWRYLLMLVLVTSAVLSVVVARAFRAQMRELVALVQQLPTITIINGTATLAPPPAGGLPQGARALQGSQPLAGPTGGGVDAPQPVRLERRDVAGVGDLLLVVDTTGRTTALTEPSAFSVLLTAHELVISQGRRTKHYDLRPIQRMTIDDAFLAQWGRRLTRWCYGLIPLALFVYGLCARAAQALLWSAISWAVGRLVGRPLAFATIWRVAVFALGPPALFAAIVETLVLGQTHPILWAVYLAIYVVLFNGALAATARNSKGQ